jgi:hypothetical protein
MIVTWLTKLRNALFKRRSKTNTVRYMFSATVMSLAAFLGASVISSQDVSYVRLEVSESTVEAGDTVAIDVYAFAHEPVNAVDITLSFESTALEVTGVDRGQSVLTIWTEEPIVEDDKVIMRGGTFRRGFVNEHLIATVNFKALETGQKTIAASDVLLLAGDGQGSAIQTAESLDNQVSLFIFDENTDPESIGVQAAVQVVTDIDGDGEVTLSDISSFMAAWSDKSKVYDFNGDNRMTFRDFSIILADFFLR